MPNFSVKGSLSEPDAVLRCRLDDDLHLVFRRAGERISFLIANDTAQRSDVYEIMVRMGWSSSTTQTELAVNANSANTIDSIKFGADISISGTLRYKGNTYQIVGMINGNLSQKATLAAVRIA